MNLIDTSVQIHVDRYKHSIYTRVSDPFLRAIVTRDQEFTRFHCCERFDRCSYVALEDRTSLSKMGKHVVSINPVNIGSSVWETYIRSVKQSLSDGDDVKHLVSIRSSCRCHIDPPITVAACPSLSSFPLARTPVLCISLSSTARGT